MNEQDTLPELDTEWITEEDFRYIRENVNLESISCYFVYIGLDKTICKVVKDSEILSSFNGKVGILNTRLLYLIQNKRYLENGHRYKMENLVKYVIKGEECDGVFLKEINFLDNIVIEPSPSIFHSLAGIYFFLREDPFILQPIKSILKSNNIGRSTKKVRILEELSTSDIVTIKTKKNRD